MPAGGERTKPRTPKDVTELIPADLDLVVRIDLKRARSSLGPDTSKELLDQAADRSGADAMMRKALAEAEVAWLALRVADAEAGDRVLAIRLERQRKVEGEAGSPLEPDPISWKKLPPRPGVQSFGTRRNTLDRGRTQRIYLLGERGAVFASPVEVPAVDRVLDGEPDAARGRPDARGVISLDYRAGLLSPRVVRDYPSLARLWRGIRRVTAVVDARGDVLELEGRIRCRNPAAAKALLAFLQTIKEGGVETKYGPLIEDLDLSQTSSTLVVRWPWRRDIIAGLLLRNAEAAPPPPEGVPAAQPQ